MVYKNIIGDLESKATISKFGNCLYVTSTSDCPKYKWDYIKNMNIDHIIKQMQNEGWLTVLKYDGYNDPIIKCVHKKTQDCIDGILKDNENKYINAERGFIRFGDIPKNGLSINHRTKNYELGVSVFEAEFIDKDYRVLVDDVLKLTYLMVLNRPAYRVFGDIVGYGADGEPVVIVKKTIKL